MNKLAQIERIASQGYAYSIDKKHRLSIENIEVGDKIIFLYHFYVKSFFGKIFFSRWKDLKTLYFVSSDKLSLDDYLKQVTTLEEHLLEYGFDI